MEAEKYNENPAPSSGYYPKPGWKWQKPEPKIYLQEEKLDKYAQAWILNLVEFFHWILLIPSFILSFLIFQHADVLAERLGTNLQVYLLSVAPVIQAFAGLVPVVMHEYEGWQVVYFKNPLDSQFEIVRYNNEWLREIAYKMLFLLQVIASLAFSLGVFGVSNITISFAIISITIAFLCPQEPKATFLFYNQPVYPISIYLVSVFVINLTVNYVAYFYLFSSVLKSANLPSILSGLVPLLFMLGGVFEGVFAESTFNQWIHFGAVIFFLLGLLAQIYFFSLLW